MYQHLVADATQATGFVLFTLDSTRRTEAFAGRDLANRIDRQKACAPDPRLILALD